MIEGQLIARKVNSDPPGFRIWFDAIEIGSVCLQHRHPDNREDWRWGVDTMPLLEGSTEPKGDAWSFEAALEAFRASFFRWVNNLHPGDWQRNRDHIKALPRSRQ